jgi:4,5-DOPA dioxygenase extradiol
MAMGKALAPLRQQNVLIIGSGSLTHNLAEVFRPSMGVHPDWAKQFEDWVFREVSTAHTDALINYRTEAPHGGHSHPTDEHFLPLFFAMGAGTPGVPGRRLHESMTFRSLAMDAYAFD